MNPFVWTDLSTYDLGQARRDYARLFGWTYSRGWSYDLALLGSDQVAGLYPTPQKMRAIQMPSFWMSYFQVEHLEPYVEAADAFEGAKIEVRPEAFSGSGRVALIRDPAGAGFTLYEGEPLNQARNKPGCVRGLYHHCADAAQI